MLAKILDYLPPPKFLNIPFAGLSISDGALRCIQFGKKGGEIYIEKYAEKIIPAGIVNSGQINNIEELKKILQTLKKDLHLDYVRVSLPEEKAYLFTTTIPAVKQNEIRGVIESKIEDNVPLPGAELIFDYELIDNHKRENLDVVVSAAPVGVVSTYVGLMESAGLVPLSLEIESQAVARALLKKDSAGTVMIVHFGQEKVGLYVASGGVVHFTSTSALKGESINNPEYLSQEIKKLGEYWHELKENLAKPEKKISQIIICGENFADKLITYIGTHNKTPTTLGNVWANAFDVGNVAPIISFSDSLRYVSAIGLALPSLILI